MTAPSEITVAPSDTTGTTLSLQVAFRPRNRTGWRDRQIKLHLKGFRRREVTLPFKAMVDGVVDTEPSFLNFGTVTLGQTKTLTMRVVKRTNQPSFLTVTPSCGKIVFKTSLSIQPVLEVPFFAAVEGHLREGDAIHAARR